MVVYTATPIHPMFGVDLTEVPHDIRVRMHEHLTNENSREIVLAKERQLKIAKFYHDNRPRSIDGIGNQEMAIDPYISNYCRWKYGDGCWEDEDFVKWFKKQCDEAVVRSGGTKFLLGYRPPIKSQGKVCA